MTKVLLLAALCSPGTVRGSPTANAAAHAQLKAL
jgi:hypothetical protein